MRSLVTSGIALLLLTLASAAAAQTSGGPDAFGYVFQPASYDFVPLAGIGLATTHPVGDDGVDSLPLPWPFPFYDSLHGSLDIGANGGLSFAAAAGVGYANQALPSSHGDSPDIAVFWDDLNPAIAGGVYSFHEWVDLNGDGTPEIDRFILSWEEVPRYYNVGAGSFQVQLYPSGEIQFHWQDTVFGTASYNYGGSATVGIQDFSAGNHSAGWALQASANSAWISDGSATSFEVCPADNDGDGFPDCLDCDDSDPSVYPGAAEICDGLDNDCDPGSNEMVSGDTDGQSICAGDCDDADPANYSGNTELCDFQDNDCDGSVDEDFDGDGDGFINLYEPACAATYVASMLDCDDSDPLAYPGAAEICDGVIDHDCDGQIDEGSITRSGGGIGTPLPLLGVPSISRTITVAESAVISDVNVTVNIAHGRSSDLDIYLTSPSGTLVELSTDNGGSGTGYSGTVFDDEAGSQVIGGVAPFTGAYQPEGSLAVLNGQYIAGTWTLEVIDDEPGSEDGILGGWTLEITVDGASDTDGDGYTLCQGDCDDLEPTTNPSQSEVCDGADNNCDGVIDEGSPDLDGDTWGDCPGGDCNDSDPMTFPGSFELCDGFDNDCNGIDDAEAPGIYGQETDDDGDGYVECGAPDDPFPGGDCNDADDMQSPGLAELCDGGTDNDCDPATIETVDADGDGESICDGDCDDDDPSNSGGGVESCDGLDNDCDGGVDEDFDLDGDGSFDAAVPDCVSTWPTSDCDDSDSFNFPGNPELCDGLDNNCDGLSDELRTTFEGSAGVDPITGTAALNRTVQVGVAVDGASVAGIVIDIDVTVDISHSAVQDLELTLISPSGTAVLLTSDNGGFGEDLSGTTFDDEAPAPIIGTSASGAPFAGRFAPEELLSVFAGEAVSGLWTLNIVDDYPSSNDGVLNSWFVHIAWEGDGDGSYTLCPGDDCDDTDPTVSPLLPELCDGIDNDCDGYANFDALLETDQDGDGAFSCADCDDSDPAAYPGATELCDGIDNDCDPSSDETSDNDGDGLSTCAGDCDDSSALVYPGALEICDGLDNDCDGALLPAEALDEDGDGSLSCLDCDDTDAANFPENVEICDGQDNDCELLTDEVGDFDLDGQTLCDGDCDDTEASTYLGASELCDGEDNDCDGAVDPNEFIDSDGDGSLACADCNDLDVSNFPGNVEICDGWDNDCDTSSDEAVDGDGDGFTICDDDCDDTVPESYPGAAEICDGLDNDCDPLSDEDGDIDGDGSSICDGDCNDSDPQVHPLASELCDGLDTNCDGSLGIGEVDLDEDGVLACQGDCDPQNPDTWPGAPEICDGLDNDCDGATLDEEADEDLDGFSPCAGDCDDTEAASFPGAEEICDGEDNDCDGLVVLDEVDGDTDGWLACDGDCDDDDGSVNPDALEAGEPACSDAVDNDCDGAIDDKDDDCADEGDDDDTSGDDDDSAGDDNDSAGGDDGSCSCTSSLVAGEGAAPRLGLALSLLFALLSRRQRRCRYSA